VAGALSCRHEEDATVHAFSVPSFPILDEFRVEAVTLPEVIAKRIDIATGTTDLEWALVDNLVVQRGQLFLPTTATA
jgi:hypothetical protein